MLEVILTVSEQSYLLNPTREKGTRTRKRLPKLCFNGGKCCVMENIHLFLQCCFHCPVSSSFVFFCGKTCKAQNGCEELNVIRGISGSAWKLYSVAVLVRVSSPFYRQEKSGIFFGWLSCNTFFIFFSGEVSFIKSQSAGLTFKAIVLEIHTTWISLCAKDV